MKTLTRLLLKEQSDLGRHCLPRPICPKTLDHYVNTTYFSQVKLFLSLLPKKILKHGREVTAEILRHVGETDHDTIVCNQNVCI